MNSLFAKILLWFWFALAIYGGRVGLHLRLQRE